MSLFTAIIGYAKRLASFAETTERNTEDIRGLRKQVEQMSYRMEQLHAEILRVELKDRLEREKLVLQLENALLRFEKRLPAPKSGKESK